MTIVDNVSDKLIEKYSFAFRVYADLYNAKHRNRENPKCSESGKALPPGSLSGAGGIFAARGAILYGKDLLGRYEPDPGRTILFVTHELTLTGAPIVLFSLIRLLQNRGQQVLLLSREDGNLRRQAVEDGIPVLVAGEPSWKDLISEIRTFFRAIIVNTIESVFAISALNGTDTPVIWWIHESAAVYGKKNAQRMPRRLAENIHVYCAGEYARRMLKQRVPRYQAKLLLYQAKDLADRPGSGTFRNGNPAAGRKLYLCVGTIHARKGQDVLLQAVEFLPNNLRDSIRICFVGTTEDERIRDQILNKSKALPEMISFYEGLAPEDLFSLYRSADWLICPSRDDPMPVVVAEAMSLGKPCICSDGAGSFEIIKEMDSGMGYVHNAPRRLAARIAASAGLDDGEYQRLSKNARKAYEKYFSQKAFETNLEEITKDILLLPDADATEQ